MFAASKTKQVAAAGATTDPFFPYVPLLLETTSTNGQQNNTFLDSSTNNFTITRNGTPTQGSVTPYWTAGQWSNYFNGSSDYLTTPTSTALQLGTGDFTVECWTYLTARSSSYPCVFSNYNSYASGALALFAGHAVGSTTAYQLAINGIAFPVVQGGTIVYNSWVHLAVVRSGGVISLYVNGTSVGTPYSTAAALNGVGSVFYIGNSGDNSLANYINGYISNFRVVKGTAVYTANFTPPITPLTAITNTSLLTCQSNRFRDNSTNNFTLTTTGTPRTQAFQPFSPVASYTTAAYGGSGYFNGTSGNYLSSAANAAFAFGTGDFTIEAWVYITSYAGTCAVFDNRSAGNEPNGLIFYVNASGQISIYNSAALLTASTALNANSWNHVAVTRSGTTATLWLNGTSVASGTVSTNFSQNNCFVGAAYTGTANLMLGYISNLRIVKGTAVYTSAFTPPTAPVTAITNTSLLTNFTNAGIYDAAVQNNAITVGDAQSSTTQSKWSPTSMKYDGTGDWLTAIDSPQLQIGTGDFTIDGWVYLSAISVAYGIISKGTATTGWSVNVTALNKLQFSYTASVLTGTTSLATGTWYYFAVVRSGSATGNLKIYLNGTADATSGGAVTDNFNQTSILYVGADRIGTSALNGYLQDVRITKYARTITTPTAAFPTR